MRCEMFSTTMFVGFWFDTARQLRISVSDLQPVLGIRDILVRIQICYGYGINVLIPYGSALPVTTDSASYLDLVTDPDPDPT